MTRGTGCGHDSEQTRTSDICDSAALDIAVLSEGPAYDAQFPAQKVLADDGDQQDSIWLTPNGENSWFVLDMGSLQSVSGFSIRNTNNANHGDRWTTDFQISVSADNAIWLDAASGTLEESIAAVQSILCSVSANVRYVKFETLAGGNAGRGLGFFRPDVVSGGFMSAQGSEGQNPTCQTDETTNLAVRCCAVIQQLMCTAVRCCALLCSNTAVDVRCCALLCAAVQSYSS